MNIFAQKLNIPNRAVLIKTTLPARDRCLKDQIKIFPMIFSTRSLHSPFVSMLAVIGIPKYLNGSVNPLMSRHSWCVWEQSPPNTMLDFSMFALSPEHWVKYNAGLLNARIRSEGRWALLKMIKSSANIRCVKPIFLQWEWNTKPWVWLAFLNSLDRYSMVNTNSKRESGLPAQVLFYPWRNHPVDH